MRTWHAQFDDLDRMALEAFKLLGRRSVRTMGLTGLVLRALPYDLTPEDALGLVERLALLAEHRDAKAAAMREGHDGG